MPKPSTGIALCFLLVLLAGGCAVSTTRTASFKPIPSSTATAQPPPPPSSPRPSASPEPAQPLPRPPTATPTPSLRPEPALRQEAITGILPAQEWLSLESWLSTNAAAWGRFQTPTNQGADIATPAGPLRLVAGSQQAQWRGLNLWLGFPLVASNGAFLIHRVDAEKNLVPLLQPPLLPSTTNPVVVIDPGHGGINAGTRSILGNRFEKDFTLDWALRLRPLLESNGWTAVLTRTNDVDLSLADRVAVADRVQASLFISLHFNSAFPRQDQAGLETYCLTPAGLPSNLTRDFEDDPSKTFPNNQFDAPNLHLALAVHQSLLQASGAVDRGVRRARFMGVLRPQTRPAILVEGGYLSSPEEAGRIARPEYRQTLAEAISRALTRPGDTNQSLAARAALPP